MDEVMARAGQELGVSPWTEVPQERIDAFAAVTGDHQWIHIDQSRASSGPFGSTIAHGLLLLSLGPGLMTDLLSTEGFTHAINYGYGKVRFPAALPAGRRVRLRARLASVTLRTGSTAEVTIDQQFEAEGMAKPVCVAEAIALLTE
ncbi:MaoC family dehydratase [Microbacterium sp. RD1]|uniref:MaoC family dehydratase n=1 Tax=Microbacterium sp. RD1 TaxID=3457313 RepID=UPI003FA53559